MKAYPKWMVKAYLRTSTANTQPENIRPPDVLLSTTKYIVNKIIDANFFLNVKFAYPRDRAQQRRSHDFTDIFTFACDRLKAVRQDITILNEPTEQTMYALEIISRFYALCCYEAQTATNDVAIVDFKILTDEFAATLSMVIDMYAAFPNYKYVETKAEMWFFSLLLHAENDSFINSFIASQVDAEDVKV